jgi:uncharacterized protein YlxW (UPF0749 family)
MNLYQRWKRVSLPNKLLASASVLMAFGTLFYAGVAIFQYRMTREQADTTKSQLKAMQEQSNVMQRSLDTLRDQANSARAQTNTLNETLRETKKTADATVSQANTSRLSARAAERSVEISSQSLYIGNVPMSGHRVWVLRIGVPARKLGL